MQKMYDISMRTTLDLPEEMVERARRAANLRTKTETVVAGLEELIRKGEREELRRLAGRVSLEVDLTRSRRRRKPR
jgi:Arc/MetJ family transcription regulator